MEDLIRFMLYSSKDKYEKFRLKRNYDFKRKNLVLIKITGFNKFLGKITRRGKSDA